MHRSMSLKTQNTVPANAPVSEKRPADKSVSDKSLSEKSLAENGLAENGTAAANTAGANGPASGKAGDGLARAVMAHLRGDPSAALRSLPPGAAETPETAAARAHLLAELKRYEEAVAEYEKLLALRPHYAEGHYQCGACLYHLGRFAEAL